MEPNNRELSIDDILEKIKKEVGRRNLSNSSGTLDFNDILTKTGTYSKDTSIQGQEINETRLYKFVRKVQHILIKFKIYKLFYPFAQIFKKLIPSKLKYQKGYNVKSLLKYEDKYFIINAYRAILGRDPDGNGLANNLDNLRNYGKDKIDILMGLRNSQEGRIKDTCIYGLKRKYFIHRINWFISKIPIIGYILRILFCIIGLPTILRNMQESSYAIIRSSSVEIEQFNNLVYETNAQFQIKLDAKEQLLKEQINKEISEAKDQINEEVSEARDQINKEISEANEKFESRLDSIEKSVKDQISKEVFEIDRKFSEMVSILRQLEEDTGEGLKNIKIQTSTANNDTSTKFNEVNRIISDLSRQTKDHKLNILDQQRRISLLLEEVRRSIQEQQYSGQINNILSEEDHLLDSLYVSFEDAFRGTRQDIKERLKVYLPYMENINSNKRDLSIIDLGCGRGEWIELLGEYGYSAKGVDLNRIMVNVCKELNLDVVETDAIEFLRRQKSNSFEVITGFHIVEHLPLKALISLFDECLRVLKPNGLVIFETPNPENIIVGSCNFYTDPTHNNPIPPETLKFLLDARGFSRLELLKLHPMDYFDYDYEKDDPISHIAYRFNMEQDYSIVAVKA